VANLVVRFVEWRAGQTVGQVSGTGRQKAVAVSQVGGPG
jgi:hypothetical protein